VKNKNNLIKIYERTSITERINLLTKVDSTILSTESAEVSFDFCKYIALGHYENFPVGSVLIPQKIRKHFYSIYAFSRFADDIADYPNILTNEERIKYLCDFENILDIYESKKTNNPIFLALSKTIEEYNIPVDTLKKLINAFKIDVNFKQTDSIEDLEYYCSFSANTVGELILRLFNQYNSNTSFFSDKICTGLQLLNFWQDLSVDIKNGRNYIPIYILNKHSLKSDDLFVNSHINLKKCLDELLEITENYFTIGQNLLHHIDNFRLKLELKVIIQAGFYFLNKMKKNSLYLLKERPKLKKIDTIRIFAKALLN